MCYNDFELKNVMRIVCLSFDDGTIYDERFIGLLIKYGLEATLNLNSGLKDFVWYYDDRPIKRLDLSKYVDLYKGHEVASHSLTHPFLTNMPDDAVYHEVKEDVDNIERIFDRKVTSFSFPFDGFDERTINIIKSVGITHIILPEIDDSFRFPIDTFHIKVTSWNIDDALEKFEKFIEDKNARLFVYLSHSYDYKFDDSYDKLERLCQLVTSQKHIKTITICEIKN